jgi:hypothetical protein
VCDEVRKAILDFLNFVSFEPMINYTLTALIPKCATPSSVTEFRPIRLCNFLYK